MEMHAEETFTIEALLDTYCVVKYLYLAMLHFLVLNPYHTNVENRVSS